MAAESFENRSAKAVPSSGEVASLGANIRPRPFFACISTVSPERFSNNPASPPIALVKYDVNHRRTVAHVYFQISAREDLRAAGGRFLRRTPAGANRRITAAMMEWRWRSRMVSSRTAIGF
jgi:hypothetical protein